MTESHEDTAQRYLNELGQFLKSAREGIEISEQEASNTTRINLKIIRALESGNATDLPAESYTRAFIRNYAKFLKADPEKAINLYNQSRVKPAAETEMAPPPVSANQKEINRLLIYAVGAIVGIILFFGGLQTYNRYHFEAKQAQEHELTPLISDPEESKKSTELSAPDGALKPKVDVAAGVTPNPVEVTPKAPLAKSPNAAPETTTPNLPAGNQPNPSLQATKPESPSIPAVPPTPTSGAESTVQAPSALPKAPPAATVQGPLNVLIEALGQVQVRVSSDGTPSRRFTLQPNSISRHRANTSMQIELSNAGAVNLIVNGVDRGIPGQLGRSAMISLP